MSVHTVAHILFHSVRNNCASMNECFTDPIFGNFRVERKKAVKGGGTEEEREGLEGKVSYSVSSDLQIT